MTTQTLDARRTPHDAPPPDAVQWAEGLLLAPQHFQAMWLRAEELLHYHLRAGSRYHWGVRRLAIDGEALTRDRFRVKEIEAILEDGLVVAYDETTRGALPELSVALPKVDGSAAATCTVYLTVPRRREARAQRDADREDARWVAFDDPAAVDINTGKDAVTIARLAPQAALFAGTLPPGHVTALPIARLEVRGNGYGLTAYVPPPLGVASTSAIGRLVADALERVRAKAGVFARRVPRAHRIPGDAGLLAIIDARLNLHGLASSLPLVEAVAASPDAHPYSLYLALCGLAGVVSATMGNALPEPPPPYDHADPWTTFSAVVARIDDALAALPEMFRRVRFDVEDDVFRLVVRRGWIRADEPLLLGVMSRPEVDDRHVMEWMRAAFIGPRARVDTLRIDRTPGLARERVDPAVRKLDVLPTEMVFAVRTEGLLSSAGESDVELQVLAPPATPNNPLSGRGQPSAITLFLSEAPDER